jgi:formylmethanofuran:tetrahydromethanopterin formyltransferase
MLKDYQTLQNDLEKEVGEEDHKKIVYEFVIDGMTCVACSSAIERGLVAEFKDKGLVDEKSVNVILLVHKMKVTLFKSKAARYNVDSKRI